MSDALLELDKVDDFLTEIEKKYSSNCTSPKNELEEQLNILSQVRPVAFDLILGKLCFI